MLIMRQWAGFPCNALQNEAITATMRLGTYYLQNSTETTVLDQFYQIISDVSLAIWLSTGL